MKKPALFILALVALAFLIGLRCDAMSSFPWPQPEQTNAAPSDPATPSAGVIASGSFSRPAISVAQDGTVYVAAEGPNMQEVHLFTMTANRWSGGLIAKSEKNGTVNASRVYGPDVEAGPDGVSWTSMRCGTKEWGAMHGPAIYIRQKNGTGKWSFLNYTTGAARLAVDPADQAHVVLLTKNGAWMRLSASGQPSTGTFPAGSTGEKYAFTIGPNSIWHTAHNGYSAEPSAYAATGIKRQTWADYATYPDQGNDLCYPSLCAANGKAYVSSVYGGRNRIQVMEAGKPRYSVKALPSLGPATLEQRCPPRLVATAKGVVAVWKSGQAIVAVNVERCLAGSMQPRQVASGSFPDADTGPDGRIHLVYVAGSALKYQTMEAP